MTRDQLQSLRYQSLLKLARTDDHRAVEAYGEIVFGNDPVSGLKSIIAIHSTALGPALGGTRFFPYETEEEALADLVRTLAPEKAGAAESEAWGRVRRRPAAGERARRRFPA
mgnify:CR=1 FL=1